MSDVTRPRRTYTDAEIKAVAGQIEPHDFERIAPPVQVWNNIAAEFEVERASEEALARSAGDNVKQGPRSWFSGNRLLGVAAAVVLFALIAAGALTTLRSNDEPTNTELASASLTDQDLPVATDETAQARFICDDDGACVVEVDLSGVPDAGTNADLELWVINGDVTDMHSLGLVTEDGTFSVPDGVTTTDFPIVDISIEPRDGVPEHSGQSVLRGVFESS